MDQSSRKSPENRDGTGGFEGGTGKPSAGKESEKVNKLSEADKDHVESRRMWKIAGAGFQFAGTVVVFFYLGTQLDQRYGWGHKATLTLTILGTIGSFYLLIKEAYSIGK